MSRLDPSRELRDFLDVIEARAELARDSESMLPEHERTSNQSSDIRPAGRPGTERDLPDARLRSTRDVLYDRDRGYSISPSEIRSMIELGKFRVIAETDLGKYLYGGEPKPLESDIQNLVRQGLVRRGRFQGPEGSSRELLTLTKRGHRLLRANQLVPQEQVTYSGFVKPREANHDADLYRLYQKEAGRIEQKGGRVGRVVLISKSSARSTAISQSSAARRGLRLPRGTACRSCATRFPSPTCKSNTKRAKATPAA